MKTSIALKNRLFALSVICSAALWFVTCANPNAGYKDDTNYEEPVPDLTPHSNTADVNVETTLKCKKGTRLTYENFGEAFMLSYCTTCHNRDLPEARRAGANKDVNLDRPIDMAAQRTVIFEQVIVKKAMPPDVRVPKWESDLLAEWLNCGVPGTMDKVKGVSSD